MFQIWECGGNEEQWGTKDTYQLRTSNVLAAAGGSGGGGDCIYYYYIEYIALI